MNKYRVYMKTCKGLGFYETFAKNKREAVKSAREMFARFNEAVALYECRRLEAYNQFTDGYCYIP